MNPIEAIMRGPYWGQYPSAWRAGLAGALVARGDKGVGDVIVNLAKMRKRLEEGVKLRSTIGDRLRRLGAPEV